MGGVGWTHSGGYTDWRRRAKEQLRAMEKALLRMGGARCRGTVGTRCTIEVE